MSKQYRRWTQDQIYLLPPSMRDWLPEGHLAWFVLDVVGAVDISEIEGAIQSKDGRGQRPYHPRMMVALLVYAYCSGLYSSRRIERACQESVPYRVITGDVQPHFTTINEFRRVHRGHFESLFVEILLLCGKAGLVKLQQVSVDGTKVRADASKHKAMSYGRMVAEEKRLGGEVKRLMALAESADTEEDVLHGAGVRGDELPEELSRRESRLSRIKEAKSRLEAEARETRAKELRDQAAGMEETASQHEKPSVQKGLRTRASNRRGEAEKLAPPVAAEDMAIDELPLKSTRATVEGLPRDEAQGNFTDPESSIMKGRDGFVQAYNAQLAVDEEAQVIVAQGVTNQPPDNGNLRPMVSRVAVALGKAPANVTADAGYWNSEVEEQVRELGSEAWVSTQGVPPASPNPLMRMPTRSTRSSRCSRVLRARKGVLSMPAARR